jgi:hypothetical protein
VLAPASVECSDVRMLGACDERVRECADNFFTVGLRLEEAPARPAGCPAATPRGVRRTAQNKFNKTKRLAGIRLLASPQVIVTRSDKKFSANFLCHRKGLSRG